MTIEHYLKRIEEQESAVQAWAHHDPAAVRLAAQHPSRNDPSSPLAGLAIGVKDIIDTGDMPTRYGSLAYRDHQPARDAWVVARLKAAGAVMMGKTVTTEFAYTHAGPTRNPHHHAHTPGGSSSGSAAAVACGMVPVALGSQTGGSTIRPSAYCGVVGFKPSFGVISLQGVLPLAPSLDTLGIHAQNVELAARVFGVLSAQTVPATPAMDSVITVAWYPGPLSDQAEPQALTAIETALQKLAAGSQIQTRHLPFDDQHYRALCAANRTIMMFEAAQVHRQLFATSPDRLGPATAQMIAEGIATPAADYNQALSAVAMARQAFEASLHGIDVVATLSAPGEAPRIEQGTGASLFNQAWTTLGVPCLTLPIGRGEKGLPLGLQLVARRGQDGLLLAMASRFAATLGLH